MRSYDPPLPVRVRTAPDGRPQAFVWDGVTHAVESIEGVREPRLDWWAAEGEQHRWAGAGTVGRVAAVS